MQDSAKIVIIGGGVMGCSLAYHLCKEGWNDLILLEKAELTSGSTWHAAGQITHSVSHLGLAKIAAYGTSLYPRLEAETGQSCSWHDCGSLRVAYEDAELDWLHYTLSIGRGLGLNMEIITPDEIHALHPFYNLDGIKAALYTPDDGHVDPAGVSFAMAAGARKMGAKIIRRNRATNISRKSGSREWVVHTEQGDIACEMIVNAGGTYARQIGAWAGLDLPITNMLHHYLITEPVPEFQNLSQELPVIRDDRMVSGYIRMEQKSGLIGIYEKAGATSIWDDGTPWEEENTLFDPDYDRIMPWLENAMARMPIFAELGIKRAVHGAITHPPDGNMMLGPSGVENFWLCCASQVGIAWGPGAGKYLAQWMVHGSADIAMNSFDPRRFGAKIDDDYRLGKAREDYLTRHEIPFPNLDRPQYRPSHSKTSPLYEILKEQGAVYQDIFGWERPFWYARGDCPQEHIHSFRRSQLHDMVKSEVHMLREHAVLADLSAFAKVEISGQDAEQFLLRVSSNKLPQKDGAITLSYMVNENGRLEGEVTLLRLGENHYYSVYAATREAVLLDWMQSQCQDGEKVIFDNVSEKYGVLMLAGPKARQILTQITNIKLDNDSFRWLSAQTHSLCGVDNVRLLRVTYTGELGWELHIPMAGMLPIYQALIEKIRAIDMGMAIVEDKGKGLIGSAALNSVRMDKAYKSGHEITNEVTLAEADLTRFSRQSGFQGDTVSLTPPQKWVLVYLRITSGGKAYTDSEKFNILSDAVFDPMGAESLWHEGAAIGLMSSGAYSYHEDAFLAWGYVAPEFAKAGTVIQAFCFGDYLKAELLDTPVFDPDNHRPRSHE